jgi:hypothetical protein
MLRIWAQNIDSEVLHFQSSYNKHTREVGYTRLALLATFNLIGLFEFVLLSLLYM